jgi:hypothetical protein
VTKPDRTVRRWARLRGRSALYVAGVLPDEAARSFFLALLRGDLLPVPQALRAGRADLLVVVGDVPHKLAPVLLRAREAMAPPAQVLAFAPKSSPRSYASAPACEVLAIDVLVSGLPPDQAALDRALDGLTTGRA